MQDQSIRRSMLIPLQLRESNDDRTPNIAIGAVTPRRSTNRLGIIFIIFPNKKKHRKLCEMNTENSDHL